jgi:dihydrolipoamide dehydrogenase
MPVRLPFAPEDPRIVDSTGALEMPGVPQRMLVIGGGLIGLEMATGVLGARSRIEVVEMLDGLMTGRRPRSSERYGARFNTARFDTSHAQNEDGRD